MTQVNLLPWREQARRETLLRFGTMLAMFMGLTFFLIMLFHLYFNSQISDQLETNALLQKELNKQTAALDALQAKHKEKHDLEQQLQFFVSLRQMSYQVIRLLNAFAHDMPNGIVLTKIERQGNMISIMGKAKSNSDITQLIKNLDKLPSFGQPELTQITTKGETNFQIKMPQEGS